MFINIPLECVRNINIQVKIASDLYIHIRWSIKKLVFPSRKLVTVKKRFNHFIISVLDIQTATKPFVKAFHGNSIYISAFNFQLFSSKH